MAGGEILATHETVHHVGGNVQAAVSLRSLGELSLRGVSQPLQVYRLETGRAPPPPSAGRSATFGESARPAEASGAAQPPRLRVFILGDFRVVRDGTTIEANDWTVGNGRQFFKCLLDASLRRLAREEAQDLVLPRSADAAEARPGRCSAACGASWNPTSRSSRACSCSKATAWRSVVAPTSGWTLTRSSRSSGAPRRWTRC